MILGLHSQLYGRTEELGPEREGVLAKVVEFVQGNVRMRTEPESRATLVLLS